MESVSGLQRPSGEQLDDAISLDCMSILPEIAGGIKGPVQRTNNPVLQSFDIDFYLLVKLFPPRGEDSTVIFKPLHGILAQLAEVVDSALQVQTLFAHEHNNHIMRITARLLHVVRENIL